MVKVMIPAIPPMAMTSPMTAVVPLLKSMIVTEAVGFCHVVRHRSRSQLGVNLAIDSIVRVPIFIVPAVTAMLVVTAMTPFFAIVLVTAIAALAAIIVAAIPIMVRPSFVAPRLVFERPPGSPLEHKRRGQCRAHEPKAKIPYALPV